jgi:hypothetical protein
LISRQDQTVGVSFLDSRDPAGAMMSSYSQQSNIA